MDCLPFRLSFLFFTEHHITSHTTWGSRLGKGGDQFVRHGREGRGHLGRFCVCQAPAPCKTYGYTGTVTPVFFLFPFYSTFCHFFRYQCRPSLSTFFPVWERADIQGTGGYNLGGWGGWDGRSVRMTDERGTLMRWGYIHDTRPSRINDDLVFLFNPVVAARYVTICT